MKNTIDVQLNRFFSYRKRIALVYNDQNITYGDLLENISIYEKNFSESGVKKGNIIGVMISNSPEFVYSLYSLWKIGAVAIPINTSFKSKELSYIMEHSGMKAIIADNSVSKLFTQFNNKRIINSATIYDTSNYWRPNEDNLEDVAIIIYTSGTTAKPKGVILTYKSLFFNVASWIKIVNQTTEDTVLLSLPLFHIFGLTLTLLSTLHLGGKGVILKKFNPLVVAELIEKYKVNIFSGVPAMYIKMLQEKEIMPEKLKSIIFCISGGAPLPGRIIYEFKKKFKVQIAEGYGLSEASPLVSVNPPFGVVKVGSVGQVIPDVDIKIVDKNNKIVKANTVGEILIKGDNVMKGYYKMPDATRRTLKNGYLHTGDLGRIDEDGYLFIVDRIKDLIITNGYNVYPKEVERTILSKSEVSEAAVIGIPDELSGEQIRAFVVLKKGMTTTQESIIEYCQQRSAIFKCPKSITIIDKLPKNATGKILKNELRKCKN